MNIHSMWVPEYMPMEMVLAAYDSQDVVYGQTDINPEPPWAQLIAPRGNHGVVLAGLVDDIQRLVDNIHVLDDAEEHVKEIEEAYMARYGPEDEDE